MFDAIKRAYDNPEVRRGVYFVGAVIGAYLVVSGVVTAESIQKFMSDMDNMTGVVLSVTNLLAALNVKR